jgi:cellulose synthase/poly-beta-1,6-N-acetylglucosamine synthase-like glycosyltransferase
VLTVGFAVFVVIASIVSLRHGIAALTIATSRTVPWPSGAEVTAIIVAHNEESEIRSTIRSLADQLTVAKIIVVDDGSTDRTAVICEKLAREEPALSLVRQGRRGKMPALRAALPIVRTELVVLMDADTRPAPGAVATLAEGLHSHDFDACSGRLEPLGTNPRLTDLQAMEFATLNGDRELLSCFSAVSILPGAFTIWRLDRLVTLFSESGTRNDIDLSIQGLLMGFRLGFARGARADTRVPATWSGVLAQRERWARRKINRAPRLIRTIAGMRSPLRARIASAHMLVVHVGAAFTSWWVDFWFALVVLLGFFDGWRPIFLWTVGLYAICQLSAACLFAVDDGFGRLRMWLVAGPWERSTRGIAAFLTVLSPASNSASWIPDRTESADRSEPGRSQQSGGTE